MIDCDYRMRNYWQASNIYSCDADVTFFNEGWHLGFVDGNHLPGRNIFDVKGLTIIQQISFIPRNTGMFFPNIEVLDMAYSNIASLDDLSLYEFPNLKVLSLYVNNIKFIGNDAFIDNPNLQAVSLMHNPVMFVQDLAFLRLNYLSSLRFDDTICINEYVENNRREVIDLVYLINQRCKIVNK
jgi:Leucine rich repeat